MTDHRETARKIADTIWPLAAVRHERWVNEATPIIAAALERAEALGRVWQPMSTAPKNGTRILAMFRPDLLAYTGRARLDGFEGACLPVRHPGLAADGFDAGWSIAAPVGHGGFPGDWFVGWCPHPASPREPAS